jgi:hypothetical protein
MKNKTLHVLLISFVAVAFYSSETNAQSCNDPNPKGNNQDTRICNDNGDWRDGQAEQAEGTFYSFFENTDDSGNEMVIFDNQYSKNFEIRWDLAKDYSDDVVGGTGWEFGNTSRDIGYWVGNVSSNAKGKNGDQRLIYGAYGWTCNSTTNANAQAQEYYIIDSWEGNGQFVPWDPSANRNATKIDDVSVSINYKRSNGTTASKNVTYDIYAVNVPARAQYCGDGRDRAFQQYWSVRRDGDKGKGNLAEVIDLSRHYNAWYNATKGSNDGITTFRRWHVNKGYVIMAAEAFGTVNFEHKGSLNSSVWSNNGN